MLSWIIGGLLTAAAITAIVIYINGEITKEKIRDELNSRATKNAIVKQINECQNIVKIDTLDGNEYEVHGSGIADNIEEGDVNYVY